MKRPYNAFTLNPTEAKILRSITGGEVGSTALAQVERLRNDVELGAPAAANRETMQRLFSAALVTPRGNGMDETYCLTPRGVSSLRFYEVQAGLSGVADADSTPPVSDDIADLLRAVGPGGRERVLDVAERVGVTLASIGSVYEAIERQGWVSFHPETPSDYAGISLTAMGRRILEKHDNENDQPGEQFNEVEREAIAAGLQLQHAALHRRLTEIYGNTSDAAADEREATIDKICTVERLRDRFPVQA